MPDLEQLIKNLDVSQVEFIEAVLVKLATVKAEQWNGEIVFRAQINQGGIADSYCDRRERLTKQRNRRARSKGV